MNELNEIDEFLNKARLIMFLSKKESHKNVSASIYFVYSDEDIDFFNKDDIQKKIYNYFNNSNLKLFIYITGIQMQRMALVNTNNGDAINLYNTIHESFHYFIEEVSENDKITVAVVFSDEKGFYYPEYAMNLPATYLKGYALIYSQ